MPLWVQGWKNRKKLDAAGAFSIFYNCSSCASYVFLPDRKKQIHLVRRSIEQSSRRPQSNRLSEDHIAHGPLPRPPMKRGLPFSTVHGPSARFNFECLLGFSCARSVALLTNKINVQAAGGVSRDPKYASAALLAVNRPEYLPHWFEGVFNQLCNLAPAPMARPADQRQKTGEFPGGSRQGRIQAEPGIARLP